MAKSVLTIISVLALLLTTHTAEARKCTSSEIDTALKKGAVRFHAWYKKNCLQPKKTLTERTKEAMQKGRKTIDKIRSYFKNCSERKVAKKSASMTPEQFDKWYKANCLDPKSRARAKTGDTLSKVWLKARCIARRCTHKTIRRAINTDAAKFLKWFKARCIIKRYVCPKVGGIRVKCFKPTLEKSYCPY